jgi:hypothetical protein
MARGWIEAMGYSRPVLGCRTSCGHVGDWTSSRGPWSRLWCQAWWDQLVVSSPHLAQFCTLMSCAFPVTPLHPGSASAQPVGQSLIRSGCSVMRLCLAGATCGPRPGLKATGFLSRLWRLRV